MSEKIKKNTPSSSNESVNGFCYQVTYFYSFFVAVRHSSVAITIFSAAFEAITSVVLCCPRQVKD